MQWIFKGKRCIQRKSGESSCHCSGSQQMSVGELCLTQSSRFLSVLRHWLCSLRPSQTPTHVIHPPPWTRFGQNAHTPTHMQINTTCVWICARARTNKSVQPQLCLLCFFPRGTVTLGAALFKIVLAPFLCSVPAFQFWLEMKRRVTVNKDIHKKQKHSKRDRHLTGCRYLDTKMKIEIPGHLSHGTKNRYGVCRLKWFSAVCSSLTMASGSLFLVRIIVIYKTRWSLFLHTDPTTPKVCKCCVIDAHSWWIFSDFIPMSPPPSSWFWGLIGFPGFYQL